MNIVNLFRISIASSTLVRDGGDIGSLGASSSRHCCHLQWFRLVVEGIS